MNTFRDILQVALLLTLGMTLLGSVFMALARIGKKQKAGEEKCPFKFL